MGKLKIVNTTNLTKTTFEVRNIMFSFDIKSMMLITSRNAQEGDVSVPIMCCSNSVPQIDEKTMHGNQEF